VRVVEPVRVEREQFADFYAREYGRMIRRATLLCGSAVVAHDLVQDVFVEMLRRWEQIDMPGPYVQRSVVRACHRARARRHGTGDAVSRPPVVELDPDELFDVLARLPYRQRAAVVLRFYDDLSEVEIAAQLGCRPGTVGSWIHRALQTLRKELSP
jgi:DNA-directed RNA polymerase specialized sigma24 family protein